jgi:hydrogenase/urease accessory protein HupE
LATPASSTRPGAALAALLCGLACLAAPASAHRLAPSLLAIDEAADGSLEVLFKTPRLRPSGVEVGPELPSHCENDGDPRAESDQGSVTLRWTLRCGGGGLVGSRFAVKGLAESGTNALLRIALSDGRRVQAVLHAGAPSFVVPERPTGWSVFRDYLRLGADHIATGFDHLLFVFGLLLLSSGGRRLVATVTAFTVGHSVTLSLAALGFVRFPSALIEVVIAGTILLLALELARPVGSSDTALRRRPWLVASGFGLLHGFGFAGALSEVGLPQQEIPMALFSFNVGIELGQLAFVALVLAVHAVVSPLLVASPPWLLRAPVTAMGALAVYWCLDRSAGLF